MKTRTSIQFDAMTGTAGVVTARSTRFGTILSGRARQPGRVTPQQKDMRALFASVGRSFKRLTPAQIDAWSSFAQQYNFGSRMEAKSPAVNAYVTLNCNRALLGLDMLKQPPTAIPAAVAIAAPVSPQFSTTISSASSTMFVRPLIMLSRVPICGISAVM